jgi:hypothetical protein
MKYALTVVTTHEIEDDSGLEFLLRQFKRGGFSKQDLEELKTYRILHIHDRVPTIGVNLRTFAMLVGGEVE